MVLGAQVAAPAGYCPMRSMYRLSATLSLRMSWSLRARPQFLCQPVRDTSCRHLRSSPQLHQLIPKSSQLDRPLRHQESNVLPTSCSPYFRRLIGVAAMAEVPAIKNYVGELLMDYGIQLPSYHPGHLRTMCPKCLGGSTKEKSLSVTISEDENDAVWVCHRGKCGWKGGTRRALAPLHQGVVRMNGSLKVGNSGKIAQSRPKVELTVETLGLDAMQDKIMAYFGERGLSKKTITANRVAQHLTYNKELAIAFPYIRDGQIVNCKYRDAKKKFWQVKDAVKVLYGLDDIKNCREIVIVEGEMDKLSMYEAGFVNCVSVPDGAPPKVSSNEIPPPLEDKKYEYLWNCKDYFEGATRIILATDSDEPGQALAEELARRLGRERCWRVNWPEAEDGKLFKDVNEVLMSLGQEGVKELIDNAELYPIRGLFDFRQFFKEIDDYYHLRLGDERGVSTGWRALDAIYRVVPGELTVVTGVPNSGKSEWIDALICNLNRNKNWTFALCSMENKVREHARKLIEKHICQPFFDAPYANSLPRMSREDLDRGKKWLQESFFLIRHEDEELPSVEWVLSLAKAAVLRHGIRGLVIDPYNELDHQRPGNQTETEYVSQMLTRIKRFAQHHDCHVWFVAHPKQLQVWKGEAPGLYDISGSAHFINKCDNGIVIHRNRDPNAGVIDQVTVLVRKVRNKAAGTIGEASLRYNRITGEYEDLSE